MNAVPLSSRRPSPAKFEEASRSPARLSVKPRSYSSWPFSSPGLSTSSQAVRGITRTLELDLIQLPNRSRSGWPTPRDMAILHALDSYRYLDRYQIQALFFDGPRSCQYRLKWLVDHGLVRAWRITKRPGRLSCASVYVLSRTGAAALAEWRRDDAQPYLRRAEHALERRFHLIHQIQANHFFVALADASRGRRDLGLYHWVGEHGIKTAYAEGEEGGPIPDGWGRLLQLDRETLLHLEWDRGTEQPRRIRAKLGAYVSYFLDRPEASSNQVLFVAPTEQREEQIRQVADEMRQRGHECCLFWSSCLRRLESSGPLGSIWRGTPPDRIALTDMPGLPRSTRRIEDCIAKPGWSQRRPGGAEGA